MLILCDCDCLASGLGAPSGSVRCGLSYKGDLAELSQSTAMSEARPEAIGDPRPDPGVHQHRNGGIRDSPERGRGSLTRSQGAQSMDSLDEREPRSKLLGKWHRNAH